MQVMDDGSGHLIIVLFAGPGRPPIVLSERRRSASIPRRLAGEGNFLTAERAPLEVATLTLNSEEKEEAYAATVL